EIRHAQYRGHDRDDQSLHGESNSKQPPRTSCLDTIIGTCHEREVPRLVQQPDGIKDEKTGDACRNHGDREPSGPPDEKRTQPPQESKYRHHQHADGNAGEHSTRATGWCFYRSALRTAAPTIRPTTAAMP